MLFPTHILVGYIFGEVTERPSVWVILGTGLPDVIDKPLAIAGVTELFHTAGHSALALVALAVAVRIDPRGVALWIGWASHISMDATQMILNGRPTDTQFLLWPVVKHVPVINLPPVEFFLRYLGTQAFYFEIGLWILAVVIASRDPKIPFGRLTRSGDSEATVSDT